MRYTPGAALTAHNIPQHIRDMFEARRQRAAPDACWPWPTTGSYGQIVWTDPDGRRRQEKTHRIAVALDGRDIPPGMLVCHACDNPLCCNPAHLFIGTHWDNHWDMRAKDRWLRQHPHLARGPSHAIH
jgi:hypothetical protein